MKIEIITNPCSDFLLELVRSSQEQLLASPFVKANVAQMILGNAPAGAKLCLLTTYKLTNFYRGCSDLAALKHFLESQTEVRSYPRLHANTYIFDAEHAIITSANLTLPGLQNNYECGVLIHDTKTVQQLKADFLQIFGGEEQVSIITAEIISSTEKILSKVPREKAVKFRKTEQQLLESTSSEPEDDLYDGGLFAIQETLTGWQFDVFNLLTKIPKNVFQLSDLYRHRRHLSQLHPGEQNIQGKIRGQLQALTALGLIEFLGGGIYRKLWKDI